MNDIYEIVEINEDKTGLQYIYRFSNGYGASVMQSTLSYGGREGLWEVCPVDWSDSGWCASLNEVEDFYEPIGHLKPSEVGNILEHIKNLKK